MGFRHVRKFLVVCFLTLFSLEAHSPNLTWGESDNSTLNARDLFKRGTIEIGVASGYWQTIDMIGNAPSSNRTAVFVLPRIGMVLTDPYEAKLLTGNLELLIEPLYANFIHPFSAEAAGGSLLLKYNLLSFGRWMPFWEAGAGMLWTNLAPRIPEQSTPFNFVLETGPGVHYFMTKTFTFTVGVRYHHISNGGIGDRNTGLDAVLPYGGFSFLIPDVF